MVMTMPPQQEHRSRLLTEEELVGTKQVLRAAGLTYVAAAASMILSLLRMLILARHSEE